MSVRALSGTVFRRYCPTTRELRVVIRRRKTGDILDHVANNFDLNIPFTGVVMYDGKMRKVLGCRRIAERLFHVVFAPAGASTQERAA